MLPLLRSLLLSFFLLSLAPAASAQSEEDFSAYTDDELVEKRKSIGLGGPISLLAIGGAAFIAGGTAGLLALSSTWTGTDTDPALVAWLVLQPTGIGLGLGGGLWLRSRVVDRRAITRELKRRAAEREQPSAAQLRVIAVPFSGGMGLGLGGNF